jgi:dimethylargininase
MPIAITRSISQNLNSCELTYLPRVNIDLDLAREQHRQYQTALRSIGYTVIELPEEPDLPDSVFVEDTAVIFPELAVITRPGAVSRLQEIKTVVPILAQYRKLEFIHEPGSLDGGDVLVLDKTVFIGLSNRTDFAAITQMRNLLTPYGYTVQGVELKDCLHLKSAVTQIAQSTLLINPDWVDRSIFNRWEQIEVDVEEPFGANSLRAGEAVIYPSSFPRTQQRMQQAGIRLILVDVSELAKAEGAVTCCSLLIPDADLHQSVR